MCIRDSPYRGAAVNKPEENFTVSGDGPTPGQEWDVSLDKSIQLYLGPNYSKSKKYESATIPIPVSYTHLAIASFFSGRLMSISIFFGS